jgi:hypothetical protein
VRQLKGQTLANVPVVTTVTGGTVGADLTTLANKTETFGHDEPAKTGLFVTLAGGTTLELILFLHDPVMGWARACDTGNLGLLGGQALPTGFQYVFQVQNLGVFDQIVLMAGTNVGGVAVTSSALVEYIERPEDRRQ